MIQLTREQCQLVDKLASERLGIPGIVLMENASRNATDVIVSLCAEWFNATVTELTVFLLCGGGNNGGDGYAIARHLAIRGHQVVVLALKPVDQLAGDAKVNAEIAQRMGIVIHNIGSNADAESFNSQLEDCDLIVDALLGTGFRGTVREPMSKLIHQVNKAGTPVIAIDVPSGLECNTGEPSNATIMAKVTITFVASKIGFTKSESHAFTGEVVVRDIGAPPSLIGEAQSASG